MAILGERSAVSRGILTDPGKAGVNEYILTDVASMRDKFTDRMSNMGTATDARSERGEMGGVFSGMRNGRGEVESVLSGMHNGRGEVEGVLSGTRSGRGEMGTDAIGLFPQTISGRGQRSDGTPGRSIPPESSTLDAANSISMGKKSRGKDAETGLADIATLTASAPSCKVACALAAERAKQQLERRQRNLDRYLLTKGFNYFENVCTCSLSCMIHCLKGDPFVQDLLTSITIFSVGMKLCSEMVAWYLPSHVSI